LHFASKRLKNDPDIVLAAVQDHGIALQYASELLKGDEKIALAAIKNRGDALLFASERLKDDYELVLTAVETSICVLEYASERLQKDPVLKAAAHRDVDAAKAALKQLGASAADDEAEADLVRDQIAFLARVFKDKEKFVEEAQAASAAFEHPGEKDVWTTGHRRDRSAYEAYDAHA
jgi:hypothetical protein